MVNFGSILSWESHKRPPEVHFVHFFEIKSCPFGKNIHYNGEKIATMSPEMWNFR